MVQKLVWHNTTVVVWYVWYSGRSWRWQRSSDARSSVRWLSTSLLSRALFGPCTCLSTARRKRFTPVCLSGRSGQSWSSLRSVSPAVLCSCMFSAKCTSSCAVDGVHTTGSSMSRIARVVQHIGQVLAQERHPPWKGHAQMCLQNLNTCHVLLV